MAEADILSALPASPAGVIDRWARQSPQANFLVADGVRYSYQQSAQIKSALAKYFKAEGVGQGDRIIVNVDNGAAAVMVFLALNALEAVAVMISPRLAAPEQAKIIDHADPVGILTACSQPEGARIEAGLNLSDPIGDLSLLGLSWHPTGQQNSPLESVTPDSVVAAMIYTTGTTGDPKGVMLSNRNLMFTGFVSGRLRGLGADDRVLTALPLSHAFGLSAVLCSVLVQGASLHLDASFSGAATLVRMQSEEITGFLGVPAMYTQLLAACGEKFVTLPALRFMFSGGAPLDPELKSRVEQVFGLPLHNGYGMTEAGPTIAQTRLYAPLDDTSVGFVIPGVSYQIKPVALAEDGIGELLVKGPNVMAGYFRAEEATKAVLKAGWLATGDLARVSASGTLEIVGRIKELIIRNGFNIYPPEVEAALLRLPSVLQAAVVGQALSGNEAVVAFVVVSSEDSAFDPIAARTQLRAHLSGYKIPDRIVVLDAMPSAPSGKILKHKLCISSC